MQNMEEVKGDHQQQQQQYAYINLNDEGANATQFMQIMNSICYKMQLKKIPFLSKINLADADFEFSAAVRGFADRFEFFAVPLLIKSVTQITADKMLVKPDSEDKVLVGNLALAYEKVAALVQENPEFRNFNRNGYLKALMSLALGLDINDKGELQRDITDLQKGQLQHMNESALWTSDDKSIIFDSTANTGIATVVKDGNIFVPFTAIISVLKHAAGQEPEDKGLLPVTLIAHKREMTLTNVCTPATFQVYQPGAYETGTGRDRKVVMVYRPVDHTRQPLLWKNSNEPNCFTAKWKPIIQRLFFPAIMNDVQQLKFKKTGAVCEVKKQFADILSLYFDNDIRDFDHYAPVFETVRDVLNEKRKKAAANAVPRMEQVVAVEVVQEAAQFELQALGRRRQRNQGGNGAAAGGVNEEPQQMPRQHVDRAIENIPGYR